MRKFEAHKVLHLAFETVTLLQSFHQECCQVIAMVNEIIITATVWRTQLLTCNLQLLIYVQCLSCEPGTNFANGKKTLKYSQKKL
jgi:hypothetical protein